MSYSNLFKFFLSIFPCLALGQTYNTTSSNYTLSYYEDIYLNTYQAAITTLGIPEAFPLSFKLKKLGTKKYKYTDYLGQTLNCKQGKKFIECKKFQNYVDSIDGTACTASLTTYFKILKRKVLGTLAERYDCSDGWYRVLIYQGASNYKIAR